jgi:hypothetical protein
MTIARPTIRTAYLEANENAERELHVDHTDTKSNGASHSNRRS